MRVPFFKWDGEKNLFNRRKHADIDYEIASRVFADPSLMLGKDRVIEGEQRWHAIGSVRDSVCLWCTSILRRVQMAKKLSVLSRLGNQIRASTESIWNKPLTEVQKAALNGVASGKNVRMLHSSIIRIFRRLATSNFLS